MKNLKLNLKGLYGYRQSLLSRSPQPRDNREMSERRPSEEQTLLAPVPQRFARYAAMLIMLLTFGVGQMWAVDLYLRGIYSKDGTSGDNAWKTDNSNKMSESSGIYTLVTYLTAATYQFKIADKDWTYTDNRGANSTSSVVTLGTAYQTWDNGGNGNMSFTVSTSGFYKFTFNHAADNNKLTITRYNPTPAAAAPTAVVSGTNAMFYIEGYIDEGYNVLRASSTHSIDSHSTGISKGNKSISYVNTAKTNLTTNDYVSNNPNSWSGVENTNIKTAKGGEYFVANGSTSKTAAKTATTTASVSSETLSISTTTNATTGVLNGSLFIQYYIDGTFVGVTYSAATASYGSIPAGGATARTSTYNVSSLTNGSHTLKTVLTDGIIYWVADEDNFNVAHTYTISYKDKGGSGYSGSNEGSLPISYTYGTGVPSLTNGEKSGYVFDGWFDNEDCTGDPVTSISTTAEGNKTFYAKFTQIGITLIAGTGGKVSKDNTNWYSDEVAITGISFDSNYNIYAKANDHYSFSGWTKGTNSANTTIGNSSLASTTVNVSSGSVTTVNATFSEVSYTVTIDGGTTASTTAKVVTTGSATAAAPAAGKKFTGWSLGDGVTLKAGSNLTDRTIYFNATQNSKVTATYADRAQVKMYFAKPTTLGWGTLYAYAWQNSNTSNNNKAYPGVEISTTETINNVVYYVYQYYTEGDGIGGAATGKSTWDRVIFGCNTDSKKTGDLTISNGHYYFKSSTGTGKAAAITSAWCIKGSWNSYSEDTDQITHSSATAGSKSISLTTGDKTFKIYNIVNDTWWRFSGDVTASKAATAMNNADGNMTLTPTIAGSYTFALGSLDGTPTLAITYPTSYRLTYAIGTVKGNEDETSITSSPSTASGSYVPSGNTVTLTAPNEKEGKYEWKGWYINAAGTDAQQCATKEYEVTMDGTKTLYACYTEIKHDVTVEAGENGSVSTTSVNAGVATKSAAITATPNPGYYFSGWTIPDGVTIATGSGTNVITINATADEKTITANFTELDKIYFRNIFDDGAGSVTHWANVYVYFDVAWDTSHDPSWGVWYATGKVCTQMTQIEETDVYWAYVPRAFTSGNLTHVAFSEQAFTANLNFRTGNAAFRSDYNKLLNMFVPHHTKSSTQTYTSGSSYTTNYYSNGYWMKYDTRAGQGAGYYLKKYGGRNSYSLDSVFRATNDDATFIQCRIRVDGTEDSNNKYMIVSAAGLNYITDSTITSLRNTKGVSEDTRTLTDNDVYFQVKATSEGFYTFILDQSGDKMKLTVDYPVSPGDYRLKHTYVGRNKANSADSTYITYSDIIKASDAASGATVSMYLSTAGTKTLVLQECASINGTTKLPEWNAGESDGLSGVFTKVEADGDGVYQFDVTVNTSTNKVTTTENIALYDGPFYIKTDCAPGGWANYTRNEMDKNTANPTAFDYYFMKWIDLDTDKNEKKNIKCVIANKYNNAVSDTLKSDGIATMDGTEPVLDNDGSVRFSYNSKTNTLKRAYLTGAAKLTLETYEAKKIYWPSTSSDQYGSHPGFVDDVVWTYELTVDAKLGAKAGVKAAWTNKAGNDKEEMLIANTNPIISGTGSGTYRMRLVFDFKTNSLISSWTPSGAITDALSDVDVMLVREGQEASNVITFGTGGSLAPRKLVGSLKFEKSTYFGKVASWTSETRPLLTFFVSFPFDVKVSDVFGLNSAYGDAYVIRKYDGAERASKGFFRGDGTTSFWKDLTTKDTMNAYEGYIVVLDNDYFNSDAYSLWGGKSELYLYFPSSKGGIISEGSKTIPVPEHECRIDRTFDNGSKILNHMNTDSHWNLIGVPVFTTYDDDNSPAEGTPGAIFADIEGEADVFNYFYEWNSTGNDFAISSAKDYEFKAMHGYMVQYHGDVTFTGSVFTPASVAARRTVEKKNYDIELQVLNNEAEMLNRTYVALRDGASSEFVLNEDVYLSPNNRDAEIYTFAGEYDVAANRLPVENQLVQMGLNVHKAGNYTISMPSTFSGTATLVDTYTNTRTNLAIDEYEVNLPQGTCEDRFLLELNIHKVPTAIDGVDGGSLKDGNAHKFIMNDRMYILKNGVIYDACGNRVQ